MQEIWSLSTYPICVIHLHDGQMGSFEAEKGLPKGFRQLFEEAKLPDLDRTSVKSLKSFRLPLDMRIRSGWLLNRYPNHPTESVGGSIELGSVRAPSGADVCFWIDKG